MKYFRLVGLFIVLLLSQTAFAQIEEADSTDSEENDVLATPHAEGKVKWGIKLGVQTFALLGDALDNSKLDAGLAGGGYVKYGFKGRSFMQCELDISYRGSKFNNDPTLSNHVSRLTLIYADIPIMLGYSFGKEKEYRLLAGGYYSQLLNSNVFIDSNPLPSNGKANVPDFDYGLVAAAQLHSRWLAGQLMLKLGLANLNNGIYPNAFNHNDKKLSTFALEFNILF